MARVPLIGLTTYTEPVRHGDWDETAAFTPDSYVQAVRRAGGTPMLLPPAPGRAGDVLGAVQGLVVIGGPDVDPARYGAERHRLTDRPRPERDGWEIELTRAAFERGMPLLGVCRGAQLLNVALGGTLHQHLDSTRHLKVVGQMNANRIRTEPGSRLHSIVGSDPVGLCHHHQALDRIAPALAVSARAADGVVEGVEGPGFTVGVQWHPEDDPTDDRVFRALVEAAAT